MKPQLLTPEQEADLRGDVADAEAWGLQEMGFRHDFLNLFATLAASRAEVLALREQLAEVKEQHFEQTLATKRATDRAEAAEAREKELRAKLVSLQSEADALREALLILSETSEPVTPAEWQKVLAALAPSAGAARAERLTKVRDAIRGILLRRTSHCGLCCDNPVPAKATDALKNHEGCVCDPDVKAARDALALLDGEP